MIKKKTLKTTKPKKNKMYFGKATHDAIVEYQCEKCEENRKKIYVDRVMPSFDKLVENLIYIHGFYSDTLPYEILKADCVNFLFESILKFDYRKGSKAFSYFNVVAKNWLIINSKKDARRRQRMVSIDNTTSLSSKDRFTIERHQIVMSQEKKMMIDENKKELWVILDKISNKLTSDNDKACMTAIKKVFENLENLELLNKRAIFVYLRDISHLTPKQLSISMSNIRKIYKQIVKDDNHILFFG